MDQKIINTIKINLKLNNDENNLIISDVIQEVLNYCNLTELPLKLEPFVRKKVKSVINYETENGTSAVFDVKTVKEGDTSITYNIDDKTSKETIYGLSDRDKKVLQQFRRTRK